MGNVFALTFNANSDIVVDWVDIHYTINGGVRTNFRMASLGNNMFAFGDHEFRDRMLMLNPGDVLCYFFQYGLPGATFQQPGALSCHTPETCWTAPGGAPPAPAPAPLPPAPAPAPVVPPAPAPAPVQAPIAEKEEELPQEAPVEAPVQAAAAPAPAPVVAPAPVKSECPNKNLFQFNFIKIDNRRFNVQLVAPVSIGKLYLHYNTGGRFRRMEMKPVKPAITPPAPAPAELPPATPPPAPKEQMVLETPHPIEAEPEKPVSVFGTCDVHRVGEAGAAHKEGHELPCATHVTEFNPADHDHTKSN